MSTPPLRLGDLIDHVVDAAATDDPLGQLAAAVEAKAMTDELGDSLLGHFVDRARHAGCSWSDIGGALGVSKQAAQQRHGGEGFKLRLSKARGRRGGMFTRFTERARQAVVGAQEEARLLGHEHLGTEHLLLSLCRATDGGTVRVLDELGISREAVRARILELVPPGPMPSASPVEHIPFTPRAKRALETALREALTMGHAHIRRGHLILALLGDPEGVAGRVLGELGDADAIRREVVRVLTGDDPG